MTSCPFQTKPLTDNYINQVWQKEWDEAVLVFGKVHLSKLRTNMLSFCKTTKEDTVLSIPHIGHSYLTHSFLLKKEEPPACVATYHDQIYLDRVC